MSVAILGGTGKEGRGIALRFGRAGIPVFIGSREKTKAEGVARELNATLATDLFHGGTNAEAAASGTVVISTLPHVGHLDVLASVEQMLAGKLLLVATVAWPPGQAGRRSAAEEAQTRLPRTRVVAAFQTVSAGELKALETSVEDDVLVFSDSKEARREAMDWISKSGLRAVEAGPLEQARVAEALTSVLIQINKNYRVKSAGIRITGLPHP